MKFTTEYSKSENWGPVRNLRKIFRDPEDAALIAQQPLLGGPLSGAGDTAGGRLCSSRNYLPTPNLLFTLLHLIADSSSSARCAPSPSVSGVAAILTHFLPWVIALLPSPHRSSSADSVSRTARGGIFAAMAVGVLALQGSFKEHIACAFSFPSLELVGFGSTGNWEQSPWFLAEFWGMVGSFWGIRASFVCVGLRWGVIRFAEAGSGRCGDTEAGAIGGIVGAHHSGRREHHHGQAGGEEHACAYPPLVLFCFGIFLVQRWFWGSKLQLMATVGALFVAVSSAARICQLGETNLGHVRRTYLFGRQSFRWGQQLVTSCVGLYCITASLSHG